MRGLITDTLISIYSRLLRDLERIILRLNTEMYLGEVQVFGTIAGYKIGDMHPDGGIVYSVNNEGTHGTLINIINASEKFSHDEAKAKVATLGDGWELPAWQELQQIWKNRNKSDQFNFSDSYYWSSWRPSDEFAKYVRFGDGYTSDGPARNKFNICPIKRF